MQKHFSVSCIEVSVLLKTASMPYTFLNILPSTTTGGIGSDLSISPFSAVSFRSAKSIIISSFWRIFSAARKVGVSYIWIWSDFWSTNRTTTTGDDQRVMNPILYYIIFISKNSQTTIPGTKKEFWTKWKFRKNLNFWKKHEIF